MARSESCTELWIEQERQFSRELRLELMGVKIELYDKPDAGAAVAGTEGHAREYDNGTIKVTYTYEKQGDTEVFVFKSLNKSEQRLVVVPRDVFVSYSHQDMIWFDRILDILAKVERGGDAAFWTDKQIKAGQRWLDVIRDRLDSATGALLLVSYSFLARPFIRNEELPVLLDKADESYQALRARQQATTKGPIKPGAPNGKEHQFLLSWIPVQRIEPDKLETRDQWTRIRQYQSICSPGESLDRTEETGGALTGRIEKLERQLMEFLQQAFETGS